jgi:hypothetical protein
MNDRSSEKGFNKMNSPVADNHVYTLEEYAAQYLDDPVVFNRNINDIFTEDTPVIQLEKCIDAQYGEGTLWTHDLQDIDELMENMTPVVLVDCSFTNISDGKKIFKQIHRWVEIPYDDM